MEYQNRYQRQMLIPKWDQEKLLTSTILVAGAGALGNEIVKNLALLGIGHLIIIDFDTIETSNLSRTTLFTPLDIGKSKAHALANAAQALSPNVKATAIHGDLLQDVGTGIYRRADLVISGLDNIQARAKVAECCYHTQTPFLDSGTWYMGGEVRWFLPRTSFCYECTLSDTDRQLANIRRSCSGFKLEKDDTPPVPTVISSTAIIGGMVAQEALKYLLGIGEIDSGESQVYNGLINRLHSALLPGEEDCECKLGSPFHEVQGTELSAKQHTVRDLFDLVGVNQEGPFRLELTRDLIIGFDTKSCQQKDCPGERLPGGYYQLANQFSQDELRCGQCDILRGPKWCHFIEEAQEELTQSKLCELKIPPGEILAVVGKNGITLYELGGDIATL